MIVQNEQNELLLIYYNPGYSKPSLVQTKGDNFGLTTNW